MVHSLAEEYTSVVIGNSSRLEHAVSDFLCMPESDHVHRAEAPGKTLKRQETHGMLLEKPNLERFGFHELQVGPNDLDQVFESVQTFHLEVDIAAI